jgi:hypothetical protein
MPHIKFGGRQIEVVENTDEVVDAILACVPKARFEHFPAELRAIPQTEGKCEECQQPIVWRKNAVNAKYKVCTDCLIASGAFNQQLMVTKETAIEAFKRGYLDEK